MSLATLLCGVAESGPLAADAPDYTPCVKSPVLDAEVNIPGWRVDAFQSGNRGLATNLTLGTKLHREVTSIPIESIWSGTAWRLRQRRSQRPNSTLQRIHLKRKNRKFKEWLRPKMAAAKSSADAAGKSIVGVTQLDWSAGAAAAFAEVGIPWLVFVRDELQFQYPDIYRDSLESAAAVCGAGHGLLAQIKSTFNLQHAEHIPLPVDFGGRFGSYERIEKTRAAGLAGRLSSGDVDIPRIAIIGVTPEKGAMFYRKLLPALSEAWPEVRIGVYGSGSYAEALGVYDNTTWYGHSAVSEVFSSSDIHLLTVQSTGSWGRVINEAGLFGLPSVSIDIGSQAEAVGPGGIVVAADSPIETWIDALRNTYEKRGELGAAAQQHAAIIDHRRSIAMFRTLIENIGER
jgi:glycosyltransferase involved in cell wall biosynthesis